MTRSTFLHLRIPFSFFLMPVFWLGAVVSGSQADLAFWGIFIALHLFIYPASNGFNSYYDRDEGPIGGLSRPPQVKRELLMYSLIFDFLGLVLAIWVSGWITGAALLMYGLASKAYSHPAIRLKSMPVAGLLTVALFQGAFTVLTVVYALAPTKISHPKTWIAAILSSLMLFGSYPMTQIYQHEEDKKRGDQTISLTLGIKGTFLFTMGFFGVTVAGYVAFLWYYWNFWYAAGFVIALLPVLVFFIWWFNSVLQNTKNANHTNTMRLNFISSFMLNLYFALLFIIKD